MDTEAADWPRDVERDAGLPGGGLVTLHVTSHTSDGEVFMAEASSRRRVREHRSRLRAQGLRPIQLWVPDVRAPGFAEEAHRQSRAVSASEAAADDQAFVDSVSAWPDEAS